VTDGAAAPQESWRPDTVAVRGGLDRSGFEETSEGLFLTQGYVYGSAGEAEAAFAGEVERFVYSRYGNPTVSVFEERLRLLEGAPACFATATGMAAVFTSLIAFLRAGDRVVASRALFGSCFVILDELLPRWGITCDFVDGHDLAHAAGARVVVDNVFATPLLQKPLELGADIVVYSATKHIDGQGRVLGGAILGPKKYIDEDVQLLMRHTGPSMSPFNAWVLLKGLETMRLRVEHQCASARRIASWLEAHPRVSSVRYPFLASHPQSELARSQMTAGGTVVTFEIDGGKEAAFTALDRLQIVDISNNLGDAKSLVTHPATTTHRRLTAEARAAAGITDGVVRISIGLEDVDDLLDDLDQALKG
jgi:O-succinylhomoserine sulfhydrylase